jgi:glycosyl transferase, family 25
VNELSRIFARIVVINLPYRSDRRREMAAQLSRVGLHLNKLPVQLFPAVRPGTPQGFPSIGARGCFLSHLEVLRGARMDGVERLLILEDDCDFASGSRDALNARFARLADVQKWDLCYGGHRMPEIMDGDAGLWRTLSSDTAIMTTHCIGFSRRAMELAVPYLEAMISRPPGDALGGPMHVDGAYCWFRREYPSLVTAAAIPPIAVQRSSRTDVHDYSWYDRSRLLRPMVSALRRMRNRIA